MEAAVDFRPPVRGRLIEDPGPVYDAAALGVFGCEHDPSQPRMADGACAHGAGLQRHIEGQPRQPVVAGGQTRAAQGQDFGVGRGVAQGYGGVGGLRDHRARGRIDQNRADWRLSAHRGVLRERQRSAHVGVIMVDHRRQGAQKPRPRQAPSRAPVTAASDAEAGQRVDPAAGSRIAKALARAGVASRREAERFIAEGRVAVNGRVLDSPAVKIEADDVITVDGKVISDVEPTRLWRYHKPVGLLTTHSDPGGRPTVFENLPKGLPRVISVGRLDLASEGLLLLTNDGTLARALEMPNSGWIRRYRVRAYGRTTQGKLDELAKGVVVEGVAYGPIEARLDKAGRFDGAGGANIWLTVAIAEGKNREVRRVLESIGLKVNRLIRLAYGPFALATLPLGAVEEVGPRVIRELLSEHIAPTNLPRGDKIAGPILQSAQQRRRRASDPAGPAAAPAVIAPTAAPKKVYKAGWAKPAARKPVVKAGPTKPAGSRSTRKPKPKPTSRP